MIRALWDQFTNGGLHIGLFWVVGLAILGAIAGLTFPQRPLAALAATSIATAIIYRVLAGLLSLEPAGALLHYVHGWLFLTLPAIPCALFGSNRRARSSTRE